MKSRDNKGKLSDKLKHPKNILDLINVYKNYTEINDQITKEATLSLLNSALEVLLIPHDLEIYVNDHKSYIKEYYDNNLLVELIYEILKLNLEITDKNLLAKKYFEVAANYKIFNIKAKSIINQILSDQKLLDITKLRNKSGNSLLHQSTKHASEELSLWLLNKNLDPLEENVYGKSCLDFAISNKMFKFLINIIILFPGYFAKNNFAIFKNYGDVSTHLTNEEQQQKLHLILFSFAHYECYKIKNTSLYGPSIKQSMQHAYAILGNVENLIKLNLKQQDFLHTLKDCNLLETALIGIKIGSSNLANLEKILKHHQKILDANILEKSCIMARKLHLREEEKTLYDYLKKNLSTQDVSQVLKQAYLNNDIIFIKDIFQVIDVKYDENYLMLLNMLKNCLAKNEVNLLMSNNLTDILVNRYYDLAYKYEQANIKYDKLDDLSKIINNAKNPDSKEVKRILAFSNAMRSDIKSVYYNKELSDNLHYYLVKSGAITKLKEKFKLLNSSQILEIISRKNEYGNNLLHTSLNHAYFTKDENITIYLLDSLEKIDLNETKILLFSKNNDNITTISMAANYGISNELISKMLNIINSNKVTLEEAKLLGEVKFYLQNRTT